MQIRKTREGWYIGLASIQIVIFAGLVIFHEIFNVDHDGKLDTLLNTGMGLAPFVIISLADSLLIIEGATMLAERYLRRRFQDGRREGKAEANKQWESWNERRLEAERAGQTFDEPPPGTSESPKSD